MFKNIGWLCVNISLKMSDIDIVVLLLSFVLYVLCMI